MTSYSHRAERYDRFLLTSANLLIETNTTANRHERIAPQQERIDSHLEAFRRIVTDVNASTEATEIIGLQEVQVSDTHHNGEDIRNGLQYNYGLWQPHSRRAAGEHIGAVSNRQPDSSEVIPLDKNRYALALRFGEFCICVAHPMYSDAKRRAIQIDALHEYLKDEPYAALIGDFNEEPLPLSHRRKLGTIGLKSAFIRSGYGHPVTLPTPAYKQYRSWPRRIGFELLGGGLRYDDIYISDGVSVRSVGTVDSDSDHRFIYASVIVPALANIE